ncbi:MAG TPA: FG-GAP repeat protein [Rudaea sp.]|jgi:hypothetical protein|nr:FG-GAP repeat protein [Rudaea sp.]
MSLHAATSTYLSDATLPLGVDIPQFGLSVAINGDEALVAAPKQPAKAFGSVSVYVKDSSGTWSGETTFSYAHSAIDAGSYLPCNGIAIEGDTAVLGVPDANGSQGVVQILERTGSGWIQSQVLSASTPSAFELFGCGVGISGNTIVVSAPGHSGTGAGYVFIHQSGGWALQAQLTATGAAAKDAVGLAAAIDGDLIVLGAPHSSSNKGATYVFRRSGSTWSEAKKLVAADGAADDQFGAAVALSNGTVAVGAPEWSAGQGAVYIYTGSTFAPQSSPLSVTSQRFGSAVSISGNRLLVGAVGSNDAYAYTRSGNQWYQRAPFLDVGASRLGGAVAISGSDAIIGAVAGDHAYIVHDDEIFGNGHE